MNLSVPRLENVPLILKLSVMISLLVIGSISVLSAFILTKQSQLQNEQVQDFGNAMAQQLAASATEPLFTNDMLSLQLMVNNFRGLPRVAGVLVVDSQQQTLARNGELDLGSETTELLKQLKERQSAVSEIDDSGTITVAAAIRFRNATGGYVYIQVQTNSLVNAYTQNLILLLLVGGLISILALFAAYDISRQVSRPINRMLDATNRIGAGNYEIETKDRRNDELGRLLDAINQMGQGLYKKNQVEELLEHFLAKDVADKMLHELDTVKVGGERVNATVLFADIVGFTNMSEQLSPEEVAVFLNEYFNYFTICSRLYFGTIDKFIGDCAMVVFGAPKPNEEHQFHAVACAVLMQKLMRNLNVARVSEGKAEIHLRIGVNTGQMLAGVLGTQQKMEYTVVGDSVNLASRLCGEAQPDEIIITHDVYSSLFEQQKITAHAHRSIKIRGKEQKVDTYIVEGVRRDYMLTMDSLIEDVINGRTIQ